MLLRPRQQSFVGRCVAALNEEGNALGIAPTGAGKTVMFSEIASRLINEGTLKALVLAHRDELTEQNESEFRRVNPAISTSVVDATTKSWAGQIVFGMVPTLARDENLMNMPALDLVIIDEAHHSAADTYRKILDRALELNSDCRVLGVTATPNRSDQKSLQEIFTNVSDQITIGELVRSGNLVPPKTWVIDVGVIKDLSEIRKTGAEFDMSAVEQILNKRPINEEVVKHWKEKAEGRQTVVFCSTVSHAEDVTEAFCSSGVDAVLITGELETSGRQRALEEYSQGKARVIVNVAVLTEGWDHPPTSCVILLRPSSAKSTMTQMIGRGLRTVDARTYPGVSKVDCVVLDFGTSSLTHRTLEQDIELDDAPVDEVMLAMTCPSCKSKIPLASYECPICGHQLEVAQGGGQEQLGEDREPISNVGMMEINLLDGSHFQWVDLFGDDASLMSSGFKAWGGVFFFNDSWHAVGGGKGEVTHLLSQGSRIVCLAAADDWINTKETEETAHKTRRWLDAPPTIKQLAALPRESKLDFNLTRYQASARITFEIHQAEIKELVVPQ